jgi:enoyl-[acyl-carrier protein] reductase/trans-2-enoyl-CoA reductase (NAD+)
MSSNLGFSLQARKHSGYGSPLRIMIVKPKVRGFVCVTAHPEGCAAHVQEQIEYVKSQGPIAHGPKKVLVIGSSTGYGLSSRIVSTFGCGASTIGVFFERAPEEDKTASAGWYNSAAFEEAARKEGYYAKSFNGDAFSDPFKQRVIETIKSDLGQIDLIVYSLASPRRQHPKTGVVSKSVLKPIGQSFTSKTLNTDKQEVTEVFIEPATSEEIADTVAVMGGEDWEMWVDALEQAGVLAPGCSSVAYSYIGPELTWPVYKNGTIGKAKEDLEKSAQKIDALLKIHRGRAFVSVNKAVVTQASSAIPVVPLYISLLFRVMKEHNLHEGCIEQIYRLFKTQMYANSFLEFDEGGRVRIDDWEMRPEIQARVAELWQQVNTDNLLSISDFESYQKEFLKLFGFGLQGVDYNQESNVLYGADAFS